MRLRVFVPTVLFALASCKPPATQAAANGKRAPSAALCANGDRKEMCNGTAQPSPTSGDATGAGSYLFTKADVEAIGDIVEKYRKPAGDPDPTEGASSDYEELRAYIETFLNRALQIDALKPGRTVTVHVRDDESINAFADAFQRVGINKGYIKNVDARPFMATLCHEIAHSTRNHVAKRADFQARPEIASVLDSFDRDVDAYFQKQYDMERKSYTHDKAAYDKLVQTWRTVAPQIGNFSKRTESEADIVGSMICAHLGMAVDDFIAGYRDEAELIARIYSESSSGTMIGPQDLQDGEQFEFPVDSLFPFLFPLDSHPTDDEREKQLKGITDLVAPHYEKDQPFYGEWRKEYGRRRGMGLGVFKLDFPELARHQIVSATTSTGRQIRFLKPKH